MVFSTFLRQKLVVRKFVKSNPNFLEEKSKENKVLHAVNLSKCRFVLAAQMFLSVTQKLYLVFFNGNTCTAKLRKDDKQTLFWSGKLGSETNEETLH